VGEVASVVVDSALPHLDREFDYRVPEALLDTVRAGTRVRVPFAGRLVSGVVTGLLIEATSGVKLSTIKSAAAVPSFTPAALELARSVARRYGGSLWDVLRLMAPPRVASVEKREWPAHVDPASVGRLVSGSALLAENAPQVPERAVWAALPDATRGSVPARELIAHALLTIADRDDASAIIVVPDARALSALDDAAKEAGLQSWRSRGGGDYALLDHDAGPAARYGNYLAAMYGEARIVVGTRPAVLQPVPRLASITVWDDGSDALLDAHAPYFHARTVAALRAQREECALLLASFAPSVDAAALVSHGFAEAMVPSREEAREAAPMVNIVGEESRLREGGASRHWMPSAAWRGITESAREHPVAVLVPRAGYVTALACARCHTWAECPHCEGELALPTPDSAPTCRDCGTEHRDLHCAQCSSARFSAARQGVEAIAAQLQRMAPRVDVALSSAATGVLDDSSVAQGIVVATPGALPAVDGGYLRLVIIGADRPTPGGLGAELTAIRWWINAAALVRAGADGGTVTLVGDVLPSVRRALQAWDPWTAAVDAYEERRELGLPPVRRALRLDGAPDALDAARRALAPLRDATLAVDPGGATVLVSRGDAQRAVDALRELVVARSKAGESPLRLRVDAPLP
jgi:primosomal protein N' (replication factor Y)